MNKLKTTALSLALLAALSATTAQAGEVGYSFVEAGYADIGGIGAGSPSFDGWGVRGSIALGDNFYLVADYYSTNADITGATTVSNDLTASDIGLGYRHALSDKTDFFVDASYSSIELSNRFASVDDDGYRVRAGFRGQMAEKFEGSIGVSHRDLGVFDSDTALLLGGLVEFTPSIGLSFEVEAGDETRYFAGIRGSW